MYCQNYVADYNAKHYIEQDNFVMSALKKTLTSVKYANNSAMKNIQVNCFCFFYPGPYFSG